MSVLPYPPLNTEAKFVVLSDWDATITDKDSNDYMTDNLGMGPEKRKALNHCILDGSRTYRDAFAEMLNSVHTPYEECKEFLKKSAYQPRPGLQDVLRVVQGARRARHHRLVRHGAHHPRRPVQPHAKGRSRHHPRHRQRRQVPRSGGQVVGDCVPAPRLGIRARQVQGHHAVPRLAVQAHPLLLRRWRVRHVCCRTRRPPLHQDSPRRRVQPHGVLQARGHPARAFCRLYKGPRARQGGRGGEERPGGAQRGGQLEVRHCSVYHACTRIDDRR